MSKWIWYYGDFELHHSLKLHARRTEHDFIFPPFWRLDDCHHSVRFIKEVTLDKPVEITVYAHGAGNVDVEGKRHAFGKQIQLPEGANTIMICVINVIGLPFAAMTP